MEGIQRPHLESFACNVPPEGYGGRVHLLAAREDECLGMCLQIHGALLFFPYTVANQKLKMNRFEIGLNPGIKMKMSV